MQNWGNLILHFFFYKQVAPTGKFSVDKVIVHHSIISITVQTTLLNSHIEFTIRDPHFISKLHIPVFIIISTERSPDIR